MKAYFGERPNSVWVKGKVGNKIAVRLRKQIEENQRVEGDEISVYYTAEEKEAYIPLMQFPEIYVENHFESLWKSDIEMVESLLEVEDETAILWYENMLLVSDLELANEEIAHLWYEIMKGVS